MRFDRNTYFNAVRDDLFEGALSQVQVDGQNLLISLYESGYTGTPMDDIRWLSYIMASIHHECAAQFWPITEYGSQSYLEGKEYFPYIGRGFIMITWEANYRNASSALGLVGIRDLVAHPEMALDSLISARIAFRGCAEGWFTGKKLGEFFNETEDNPYDARTVINGHDDAKLIEGYHDIFLAALEAARVEEVTS